MDKLQKRINGWLESETYERYQQVKQALDLWGRGSDDECVRALLDKFEDARVPVSPADVLYLLYPRDVPVTDTERERRAQEMTDIQDALDLEYINFWTLLRQGLVREARLVRSHAEKLTDVTFAPETRKDLRGVHGASYTRIKSCVHMLMVQNLAQEHSIDVLYITQGIVTTMTGCHNEAVAQYFREHQTEIEAHHQSLGMGSHEAGVRHNRMRTRHLREQRMYAEKNMPMNGQNSVRTLDEPLD